MSKPQPACGEGLQHGQAGVGLHRIADQVVTPGKRAARSRERLEHRRTRVDEQRRAVLAPSSAAADPPCAVARCGRPSAGRRADSSAGPQGAAGGRAEAGSWQRGRGAELAGPAGRKSAPFCPHPDSSSGAPIGQPPDHPPDQLHAPLHSTRLRPYRILSIMSAHPAASGRSPRPSTRARTGAGWPAVEATIDQWLR